ncbi:MAG: hypothetical protein MNPFHGCM_00419 [Gemmatimonadaceae bacterium]|nr:hypothetical protein [Gemmatimonadaceae bacterium]
MGTTPAIVTVNGLSPFAPPSSIVMLAFPPAAIVVTLFTTRMNVDAGETTNVAAAPVVAPGPTVISMTLSLIDMGDTTTPVPSSREPSA